MLLLVKMKKVDNEVEIWREEGVPTGGRHQGGGSRVTGKWSCRDMATLNEYLMPPLFVLSLFPSFPLTSFPP